MLKNALAGVLSEQKPYAVKQVELRSQLMHQTQERPKVVIVSAGWAGLGAAHHLTQQGYDITLLEAGNYPGGLVAGWKTTQGRSIEAGIHGFWYPYRNIFALVKQLGLTPFTDWTRSSQYSPADLEVESPIFQQEPRLPTALGTFLYTRFKRLPLSDRAINGIKPKDTGIHNLKLSLYEHWWFSL